MNIDSILDLFFNDILPSIANCNLNIEEAIYNIRFNTAIYNNGNVKYIANIHNPELPTLTIKDVKEFSRLLLEFVNEIISRDIKWCSSYVINSPVELKIKYYLSLMWSNMTANDFSNPNNYIKRCISFAKDDTFKNLSIICDSIAILNNSHLEISNMEEKTCHSTPYIMEMAIANDDGHRFVLPDVHYAIEDVNNYKRAYIYSVQYNSKLKTEDEANNKYCKKINSILYKTDKDIPKEELDKKSLTDDTSTWDEENIVVVTRSSLVSLTVILTLLAKKGITEVLVPSYLPIHWDVKSIVHERKLAYYKDKGYSEEQLQTMKKEYEEEQLRIERNVTEKLLRNFRRIEYHFKGLEINAYPQDVDDFMHLKLDSDFQANNLEHILGQISDAVSNCEKAPKQK